MFMLPKMLKTVLRATGSAAFSSCATFSICCFMLTTFLSVVFFRLYRTPSPSPAAVFVFSACCAAAILEYFDGTGISAFADYGYYPNQVVYHKVMDALTKQDAAKE